MFHLVAQIAWKQQGAFTARQAAAVGVNANWLTRAVRDGVLERRSRGVYVLAAAPRTWRQDLVVEVLGAGERALATGESGLALWCPELSPPNMPVVAVDARRRVRPTRSRRLLRASDLDLANPGVVDGVPVVGVARALLDASIDLDPDGVVARINACQRHLPMSFGALVDVLHSHARRGRTGSATFRAALECMTREVPDSEFERLVLRDLTRAGGRLPELHHVVRPKGEKAIELDLAWPPVRLDVELDGRDHVARMKTARRDRQRDRILIANGWAVMRFVWADYLESPDAMVEEILQVVDDRTLVVRPLS